MHIIISNAVSLRKCTVGLVQQEMASEIVAHEVLFDYKCVCPYLRHYPTVGFVSCSGHRIAVSLGNLQSNAGVAASPSVTSDVFAVC